MQVSVLLLTHNEEDNLPQCLDALAWCDDIVVLDSGSSDSTLSIARSHSARVFSRPFDNFAAQRNYGIAAAQFSHEWVLHLDADEILTDSFVACLRELSPDEGVDAYRIPSKTILFGRWLRWAGMYPSYQVRLGRRDRLRFTQVGHGQREDLSSDRVATFDEPYLHYSFSHGLGHWLKKHLRYASDEAEVIAQQKVNPPTVHHAPGDVTSRRRMLKALSGRLPFALRPPARFLYIYVIRSGFLDGYAGLVYALMLSVYEGMIAVLLAERVLEGKAQEEAEHRHRDDGPMTHGHEELRVDVVRHDDR